VILRGAIFTAEPRYLGAQAAQSAPDATSEMLVDRVQDVAATYQVPADPVPLSSDRVASWLVTQDGATRTAVAALLSDEIATLREDARQQGYAQGHVEAMKEAREKVGGAIKTLQMLNIEAETAFAAELAQLQDACAEIVAQVFFKLAGTALVKPEAVVGVIGEVLKRVREERELRVHVNPHDLPALRSAEAGIAASLPGRQFTLVADARVETGGCIVESALGSLDGRLELQLAEFIATLRAVKESPPERGVRA